MVEKTNVGMVVFISDITSMCGFGSDGAAALLSARSLVAAAAISLYSPVLRCCFRVLLHFVLSAARPSQHIVSMSTSLIYPTQTSLYRR